MFTLRQIMDSPTKASTGSLSTPSASYFVKKIPSSGNKVECCFALRSIVKSFRNEYIVRGCYDDVNGPPPYAAAKLGKYYCLMARFRNIILFTLEIRDISFMDRLIDQHSYDSRFLGTFNSHNKYCLVVEEFDAVYNNIPESQTRRCVSTADSNSLRRCQNNTLWPRDMNT